MINVHPFRRATQVFGLLIANIYFAIIYKCQLYDGALKSICVPFLYCHSCPMAGFACPIGVMQHYMALHRFPFFLIGHLMLIGLLIGRMICGWVCPVGLFQELIFKIKSIKIVIPKYFSALPYIMLIVFVIMLPYITTEHWFSKLCPVGTLSAGIPLVAWNPINPSTGAPTIEPGAIGTLFVVKVLILIAVLALCVFAKRPFCRYICPLGLFWSFFNKTSVMKLKVDDSCTKCDTCVDICPEGISVYEDPNSGDCVRCLECVKCKHVKIVNSIPSGKKPAAVAAEIKEVK